MSLNQRSTNVNDQNYSVGAKGIWSLPVRNAHSSKNVIDENSKNSSFN